MLPAAFSDSLTIAALRFTPVAAICFREDFHLQVDGHAGHTQRKNGSQSGAILSNVNVVLQNAWHTAIRFITTLVVSIPSHFQIHTVRFGTNWGRSRKDSIHIAEPRCIETN